jgi:hypothetical protein
VVLEGFLLARSPGTGVWPTLRTLGLRDWLYCVRAVPWGSPRLALHVLRRLYRELEETATVMFQAGPAHPCAVAIH